MKNIIFEELQAAKEKMFEEVTYKGYTLAKLTRNNVAIAEAMVRNDSAYIKSVDRTAGPIVNAKNVMTYGGSSAYWLCMLKKVLIDDIDVQHSYRQIIKSAVEAVDRENSTHLNADGCGRDEITERICKISQEDVICSLKDPEYKNMLLFREIARITSAEKRARINTSFASKFCHYACFYIFEDTEYQDNYVIYDTILRTVIPLYMDYYNIEKTYVLTDYKQYRAAIDAIRKKSGIEISRNGFDHLLWYYHKARV